MIERKVGQDNQGTLPHLELLDVFGRTIKDLTSDAGAKYNENQNTENAILQHFEGALNRDCFKKLIEKCPFIESLTIVDLDFCKFDNTYVRNVPITSLAIVNGFFFPTGFVRLKYVYLFKEFQKKKCKLWNTNIIDVPKYVLDNFAWDISDTESSNGKMYFHIQGGCDEYKVWKDDELVSCKKNEYENWLNA